MNRNEALSLAVFGSVMLLAGMMLSGILRPEPVYAGTANSGTGVVAVTGLASSNQEVLFLFDSESRRLAVYKVDASSRLELLASRDTTFDLKPQEFGKQEPAVKEMKEIWEEHQEKLEAAETRGRRR